MSAEEIKTYSDQELRQKLTEFGMDVGPITGTTRTLYEKKLVQFLTGTRSEFSDDAPSSPPKSPKKASPRKSPPVVQQTIYEPAPHYDTADGFHEVASSLHEPSKDSNINLIRARKPIPRMAVEEPISRKSVPRQASPFPAANAQFRKTESNGSTMDHILKFALFGIVMIVIIYFILNQEPGRALEHRS